MERPGGLSVRLDLVIWVGLIAAAAGLRLARLDLLPLTFDESARAVDALRASRDNVPDGWTGDLAAALTSYLFRAFEDSELLLRLAPAVGGAVMVAVVALGGRGLGRGGALVAGALLAFSPLAVLFARTAEPFSLGALAAVALAVALLSYLDEPRVHTAFAAAAAFGLAFSTDAVGVTAAIAVVAFLLLDPIVTRGGPVARAGGTFLRSPSHLLSALLVLAAAAELAVTHFGTFVELSEPAGVALWRDMFEATGNARPTEYPAVILGLYEWPLLAAGGMAVIAFGWRLSRGPRALTAAQRFVLLWLVTAVAVVAFSERREAGQMLILVVPLALAGGLLAEELLASLRWEALRRWWPALPAAMVLLAYAGLLITEWSGDDIGSPERWYLLGSIAAAGALLGLAYVSLGWDGTVIALTASAVVAMAFFLHTDLSYLRNNDDAEMAIDLRAAGGLDQFRETVEKFVATRQGPMLVDPALRQPLEWYLRDVPVTFGEPAGAAGAFVAPADREVPGFTPVGDTWTLGRGWYPLNLDELPLWRWMVFRETYGPGSMDAVEARILVPLP